jgi:hypothetical protein
MYLEANLKAISTGVLAAFAAALGLSTVAVSNVSSAAQGNTGPYALAPKPIEIRLVAQAQPPADFGAPPSGEVPILYNDHHVYAKPSRLKENRTLAALIRGNTILVPLRSMFEQLGATVSYDPATKTVDISKPGSDVKVTVGKPEVVINGESRPLDVPPEIYKGTIVVPVRVLSEGLGAYVEWVPSKQLTVVRYIPAPPPTPVPTVAPTIAPPPPVATPVPTPTPTPTPVPVKKAANEGFIAGDYIISPKVYNEFSPGNSGKGGNYNIKAGYEFGLFNLPWMVEGDYRSFSYPHNSGALIDGVVLPAPGDQGYVTVIGGNGSTFVPGFTARDSDLDLRLGLKVADPRIYVGLGYLFRTDNYGYPKQNGFGFGAEKLPDLDQPFSVYGSLWFYPNVKGTSPDLAYRVLKYDIGGTYNFGSSPLYLDFGWLGDQGRNKNNAPADYSHNGPHVGLGLHF